MYSERQTGLAARVRTPRALGEVVLLPGECGAVEQRRSDSPDVSAGQIQVDAILRISHRRECYLTVVRPGWPYL